MINSVFLLMVCLLLVAHFNYAPPANLQIENQCDNDGSNLCVICSLSNNYISIFITFSHSQPFAVYTTSNSEIFDHSNCIAHLDMVNKQSMELKNQAQIAEYQQKGRLRTFLVQQADQNKQYSLTIRNPNDFIVIYHSQNQIPAITQDNQQNTKRILLFSRIIPISLIIAFIVNYFIRRFNIWQLEKPQKSIYLQIVICSVLAYYAQSTSLFYYFNLFESMFISYSWLYLCPQKPFHYVLVAVTFSIIDHSLTSPLYVFAIYHLRHKFHNFRSQSAINKYFLITLLFNLITKFLPYFYVSNRLYYLSYMTHIITFNLALLAANLEDGFTQNQIDLSKL